jgi:hypothetical protein
MELDEMKRKLADDEATRKILQGIYGGSGLPQSPIGAAPAASPAPQMGAPAAPSSAPSGGVTPKADVWQQYKAIGDRLASNGLVAQAQQYYGLAEKMRPKYGTEPRVMMGRDGKLVNVVVGEDGSTQVLPFGVKPNMKMQDLGGKVVAVDENSLANGQQFGKTMTPGEVAANNLGWANNKATLRGQDLTDTRARQAAELGTIPSGYRRTASGGLEFIPGGPADPDAAKKAAPTEFQGKSTTFGARMQDASRIIDSLEGKVSPANVARAGYAPEFPSWMPGGQVLGAGVGAANRMTVPDDAQRYYQAQENWVTANLRQESGAAIGKEEMAKDIRKWFPQPGDSDALKAQKAAARKVAERAMLVQAGPGASSIPRIVGGLPASPGAPAAPTIDANDPLGLRK